MGRDGPLAAGRAGRLRALGNWTSTTANGVTQTREFDANNEITTLDGSGGDVGYDADGNMTVMAKLPVAGHAAGHFVCPYGVWSWLSPFLVAKGGPIWLFCNCCREVCPQ